MPHPLSGRRLMCVTLWPGVVVEWTVDAGRNGPLVMRDQSLRVFSIEIYNFITSYNNVTVPELSGFFDPEV